MRIKSLLLGLPLLIMVVISGCTDKLGKVDFSGRIDLEKDTGGWAYREIASAKVRPVKVDPEDRLGEYQKDLELQKPINIGKKDYIIVAKFKTDRVSTGHDILDILLKADRFTVYGAYQVLVYNLDNNEKVETVVAKESESGDDWDRPIDEPKNNFKTRNLERKGQFVQYFREEASQRDCIIEINYRIKSEATRSVDKAGKYIEENGGYKYDVLSIDGSASIKIGFRQCLTGKRIVGAKTIRFYVLDWNLDGEFSDADVVWSDYTNKFYQFGQVVRLTDSWSAKKDNTYRLKLVAPKAEQEKYGLEVELVSKGKD